MGADRPFLAFFGISLLLHLSMFTLFSIVILLPREDIVYYHVEIVEAATTPRPSASPAESVLRVPSLDASFHRTPDLSDSSDPSGSPALEKPSLLLRSLPDVEFPALDFAQVDRLRLRPDSLQVRPRYDDVFRTVPSDSWARFGSGISRLRDALSRLPLFERSSLEQDQERPAYIGREAEGFNVYIEWMSEPRDREIIFAPPMDALLRLQPAQLAEPMALLFRVNPQGRVVNVQVPLEDGAGIVAAVRDTLFKYRFAPLDAPSPRDQSGTLLISSAEVGP